jgi:hypothetical protein
MIFITLAAIFAGCEDGHQDETGKNNGSFNLTSAVQIASEMKAMLERNPCGVLLVRRPFFNVTGHVTENIRPGAVVYLLLVRNLSLDSALYASQHCHALARAVDNLGEFTFTTLPSGQYVAMVGREDFTDGQGFPVVHEFDQTHYLLRYMLSGGDSDYSFGVFTITPQS